VTVGRALDLLKLSYEIYDLHDKQALRDRWSEAFHDDAEFVVPFGTFRGQEVFMLWDSFITAFPDVTHTIVSSVEGDGVVAAEAVWSGTHNGPLMTPDGSEVPPTGRTFSLPYAHFAWIEGDLFRAWHVYFNPGSLMEQLGLVPEAQAAATT
jgi:predicted ester cyclase